MPHDFQTGNIVVEGTTAMRWKVLYYDKERMTATCEHSGARRFIVRAINADELRPITTSVE